MLQMFSMEIADDIGMLERCKNGEFSCQLVALFLRHLKVIDLFSTQYLGLH